MSTRQYVRPIEDTTWGIDSGVTTVFNWEYDEGREKLLNLYEKGKNLQWNATNRLDWSIEVDPDNPLGIPDFALALYGSSVWEKWSEKERGEYRRHVSASQWSQFMHGEQGALICTAKIVQTVPDVDAKFYGATQVIDEARHVETYARFLQEKIGLIYPMNKGLASLIEQVIIDPRWDMTYLGMQIIIEGLALAAFAGIRDNAQNKLAAAVNAYVMQDEARHVAFGRLSLRDYYPQLTQKERDEREEFVVEACNHMVFRFGSQDVLNNLGINVEEVREHLQNAPLNAAFRTRLFTRIVPAVKEIGLWGPIVQKGFEQLGVIDFAQADVESLSQEDETVALRFDEELKKAKTAEIIELGASA
jgi:P-aminobenzoate N-oxygenase AurF